MIAVDTNLLVYAHRPESPWHEAATQCLQDLVETDTEWAVPWPCLHEFLAIVTRSTIFKEPTPPEAAIAQVNFWLEAPTLTMLGEGPGYWVELRDLIGHAKVTGAMIHDARIAAICIQHDAELWSADRDFGRFHGVRVRNPLVGDRLSERAARYGRRRRRA
jgi:uncharacterized protein